MITIYSGKPGSGKSLKLADVATSLLARNRRWQSRSGIVRPIASNIRFSAWLEREYEGYIRYWNDPLELVTLRDCDIIYDEIATHLDSTQWQNTPLEVKRFLQQHRKRGIDIYGSTQNFGMVDISMRRLTDVLHLCTKIMGSRNPAPTKPEVRFIWGLIWITELLPESFDKEKPEVKGHDWLFITKKLCQVYDTTQEIQFGQQPALRHIERRCEHAWCDFVKTTHS